MTVELYSTIFLRPPSGALRSLYSIILASQQLFSMVRKIAVVHLSKIIFFRMENGALEARFIALKILR